MSGLARKPEIEPCLQWEIMQSFHPSRRESLPAFESRPESFSTIVLYLRVIAEVPVIRAAAAV